MAVPQSSQPYQEMMDRHTSIKRNNAVVARMNNLAGLQLVQTAITTVCANITPTMISPPISHLLKKI